MSTTVQSLLDEDGITVSEATSVVTTNSEIFSLEFITVETVCAHVFKTC